MIQKSEEDEEQSLDEKQSKSLKELNTDLLKMKLSRLQPQFSKVVVNLGSEEYDKGKEKITNEIFQGKDKLQNTELFIENLQKTKLRHLQEKNINNHNAKDDDQK